MSAGRVASLWGPPAAFMIVVWFGAAQAGTELPVRAWDKALHAAAYAVLGVATLRACHGGLNQPQRTLPALAGIAIALAYGAIDEWHQSRVPGRDASVADWVADAIGVAAAWAGLRAGGWLHGGTAADDGRRR